MRPYCNRDLLLKQNCGNRYLELCLSATAHFSSFYRLNRRGSFVKCVNCYSLHTDGPGAGLERHCKYHWTVYHCIVESIQLCGNWFNRLSLLSVQMPLCFLQLTHIPAPWSPHVIKERDYIFKDRFLVTLAATQVQRQTDYSSSLSSSTFKSLHRGPILDLSYMWWRTTTCPEDSANRQLTAESLFASMCVTSLTLHRAAWLKRATSVFLHQRKIYSDRVKTVSSRLWLWAKLWNLVNSVDIQLEEPAQKLVPAQRMHQKGRRGTVQVTLRSFNGKI